MKSMEEVTVSGITDSTDEAGNSTVNFSISGTYKELTDETEENGETLSSTQTAQ